MDLIKLRRALISVTDKTGLDSLAKTLHVLGVQIVSTGGTRQALAAAGVPVTELSTITGFPEILDGRVKTLHPAIHGGILARHDDPAHQATLAEHKIAPFELVICNLYPFERVVMEPGRTTDDIIENIDIGGPTLVRAAAKNFFSVAIISDPSQYDDLLAELQKQGGQVSRVTRQRLAATAFQRIAAYDLAIASYFTRLQGQAELFPAELNLRFRRKSILRYGENPHQQAALYDDPTAFPPSLCHAEVLHGKELSFNNYLDLDAALSLAREFSEPAAVVIKHNNPCGVAVGETLAEAFEKAYAGDPLSAFGGVFGLNREVDVPTAELLTRPNQFVEAIIAPGFQPEAMKLLTTKPKWKDNVRLLATGKLSAREDTRDFRRIDGGLLVQTPDLVQVDWKTVKPATKTQPTPEQLADLALAWKVARQVKSNAIVLAHGRMVVGVGAGQMSRVDSVEIAIKKAGDRVKGAVLASDAFFPFRDNIDLAAKAGIAAIAQPGGSVRDQEVIEACNEHGVAMVFTGVRHFRH